MFAATVEKFKAKLFEEGKQEGIREGVRKGKLEGIGKIARKLKQSDIALEIISKNTALSLDEIEAL